MQGCDSGKTLSVIFKTLLGFSSNDVAHKFLKTKVARKMVHVFNPVEELVFAANKVHEIGGP